MTKELEELEEGPKVEIYKDLQRKTLKNIKLENARRWWNTWILVEDIHLHSWQTSTRKDVYMKPTYQFGWPKEDSYKKDPRKWTAPK